MGKPLGRPIKYTKAVIQDICTKMDKYTEDADIPIMAEFCYLNNIRKQRIYEIIEHNEDLSDSYKKMYEKGESQLVKMGLMNVFNPTMTIFTLKQKPYCYVDRQEVQLNQDDKLQKILEQQRAIVGEE